jgi:hypothetical protein
MPPTFVLTTCSLSTKSEIKLLNFNINSTIFSLPTTSRFQNGDAEGLGQRGVEENVTLDECAAHVIVCDRAEHGDAIVEFESFDDLLYQDSLRSVASYIL